MLTRKFTNYHSLFVKQSFSSSKICLVSNCQYSGEPFYPSNFLIIIQIKWSLILRGSHFEELLLNVLVITLEQGKLSLPRNSAQGALLTFPNPFGLEEGERSNLALH